jgi:hypothetical protein
MRLRKSPDHRALLGLFGHRIMGTSAVTLRSVSRHQFLLGLGLIAVLVLLAASGYLLGHSTGEDLDAARVQGAAQGQSEGAAQGAKEGFAAGRKEGRKAAYAETYPRSYREAYRGAYEDAGLDPPNEVTVASAQ